MQQYIKSWFPRRYVDFDFAEFKVERAAMDELCHFEIRQAIFQHLAMMVHSVEACIDSMMDDPDGLCNLCHRDHLTSHVSEDGVAFGIETIHGTGLIRVYLCEDQD